MGRILGFELSANFHQPYLAVSVQDFWRRWHLSLSSWLRDYLYIPLGGNRHGCRATHRNLLVTMLLGGLWHGAAWTFVMWGALHGGYLVVERLLGLQAGQPQKWQRFLRRVIVFHLVCMGWILFRSVDVGQAFGMLAALAQPGFGPVSSLRCSNSGWNLPVVGSVARTLQESLAFRAVRASKGRFAVGGCTRDDRGLRR